MPSHNETQTILDRLFEGVNGYTLSFADRTGERKADPSLTYGEMVLEPFERIMASVKPQPGEIFYDLGSGTGKVVMMAHLSAPFARSTGIELLPQLHATATSVIHRYETEMQPASSQKRGQIKLICGDMLAQDLDDADVIFVHSTCMTEALVAMIGEKVKTCKATTRFVMVSRGFFHMPWFQAIDQIEYPNAWKTTSVAFVYRLTEAFVAARRPSFAVA